MPKLGESYSTGKDGEKDTWVYLAQHGLVRPSKEQRSQIQAQFAKLGIAVNKRGFDVVGVDDLANLSREAPKFLYEVKTCGAERGKQIADGFKGLGFTLTSAEKQNAECLQDAYKFIFVNVARQTHMVLRLSDFFNETCARIYPTWSVFITSNLNTDVASRGNR